jgi:RING finger protein 121
MHEQHRGHESMHAEMVLILFATLVVSQIALVKWRQMYPHSYHVGSSTDVWRNQSTNMNDDSSSFQLCTLVGMWIIPLVMSAKNHWWRFLFVWMIVSSISGFVVRKAIQKPLDGSTPRQY